MKVIQLNLWLGHLLHPALSFVKHEDPDILCAQEVYSCENGIGLLAEYQTHQQLSKIFPHSFYAPTFSAQVYGEVAHYGNAIYSKFPITNQSITFTWGEFSEGQTIQGFKKNSRNLQVCDITMGAGRAVTVANHHGYHNLNFKGTDEAVASMQKVASSLKQFDRDLIFCGDLNASTTSNTICELDGLNLINLSLENKLKTTLSSVHRFKRNLVCDYIFVSPALKVNSFQAADTLASDHLPLILDYST